jgi:hypothetical protein
MAIPSSGTLSLAGIRAELTTNTYNASATVVTSLQEASSGSYGTINTANASADRPNGSVPHGMSEFYAYDHDLSSFSDSISFDLDGTNDYLEGSGSFAQAWSVSQGSVSVWIKIDSVAANGLVFQLTAEEGSNDQIFLLFNNAAGKIRGAWKGSGTAYTVDSSAGLEGDGNWHHFVMTWKSRDTTSSNNVVKLYEDGSLQASNTIGSTVWASTPAVVGFGRNSIQNFGQNWNGHLNDIAVFSDILTAVEVATIYNSGSPKDESSHSGLLAYYTMENYSNGDTSLADDSSNSYSLTITNSTDIDSTDTP